MGGDGWIKLHRKIIDNPLFTDVPSDWFKVAIMILLKANRQPRQWYDGRQIISIPAGSFVTSSIKLAEACKIGRTVVRNALQYLHDSDFATNKATNRYTIVTVTNWETYQSSQQCDNQVNNQRATNEQPTSNQLATTNKKERIKEREKDTTVQAVEGNLFALMPDKPQNGRKHFDSAAYFDSEFWPVVWKKAGIGEARRAFQKWAKSKDLADRIKAAAIAQGPEIMERANRSSRGTPILVSSWLNGERFNDDLTEIKTHEPDPYANVYNVRPEDE